MVGNDWSEKYDEITNEMPVNDAEKRVLQMLQKGSTILEAREANGLSDVEMGNLMERAKKAAEDCARLLERCPLPEVEDISRLNQEFIRDNLSPGGCADLLAASFFIAKWKDLG